MKWWRALKLWWLIKFTDRIVKNPLKVGSVMNKLCPCMSGKKIKACHGRADYIDVKDPEFLKMKENLAEMRD